MNTVKRRASFEAKNLLPSLSSNLVSQLTRTEVVARLRQVSFLGAIDYSPWASKAGKYLTSRFDHSVGVACLADRAAKQMHLDNKQRDTALAAALLHDIGHGPLSHSLESAFDEAFGINHHKATAELLLGSMARSRSLRSVLKEYDVDADDVARLMTGELNHPLANMFLGPVNFDTVEGILRGANYRLPAGLLRYSASNVVDAMVAVSTGQDRGLALQVMDDFWQLKGLIYSQFVRGTVGVVSDFKCQAFFNAHRHLVSPSQFFWTDSLFKQSFPTLFRWLQEDAMPAVDVPLHSSIPYVRRTFTVDTSVDPSLSPASFMGTRYRQKKTSAVLDWRRSLPISEGVNIWDKREKLRSDGDIVKVH